MKSKKIVTVVLIVVVVFLLFLNFRAILRPAKYEEIYEQRRELNLNRLMVIAELQGLYTQEYQHYAPHIDSLVNFYEKGHLTIENTSLIFPEGMDSTEVLNLSMKQREEQGLVKKDIQYVGVKGKMAEILKELNKNKEGSTKIEMKDFQYIPFTKTQYKIVTPADDSTQTKFAIFVPVNQMMSNFTESLPKSTFSKMIYGGMENLYNDDVKKKDIKDSRNISKFVGLQLGDTVYTSTEITSYGKAK
ncbi:MAG: hypothetical protein J5642_00570 [Bacteroidales bacterium]|nr:hypothetical protein [Bacteroidales bacterium]